MGEIVIPAKFNAHKNYKKMMFLNPYRDVGGGVSDADSFNILWETSSADETIEIGVGSGYFDYTIDWGDGSPIESYNTQDNISHIYPTAGLFTTKINGVFPHMGMAWQSSPNGRLQMREIQQWGNIQWGSFHYFAWGCRYVTVTATDVPDLSNVLSFTYAFGNKLINLDIPNIGQWNFSNVISIYDMFMYSSFNRSLGAIDISNISSFGTIPTLSNANYDDTLIGWASQTPQINRSVSFSNSQYTPGGAAETARNTLINTYGWTIEDGGGI